jgi:peptide/nickel transport system permease protein
MDAESGEQGMDSHRSGRDLRNRIGLLTRHRLAVLGLLIVLGAITAALFAPLVAPYDPLAVDLRSRLIPPLGSSEEGSFHFLGTDTLGRDILSRIIFGARISLSVATLTVMVSAPLGTVVGMCAGFFGGGINRIVLWVVDVQLAIPFIVLAIAIIAVVGPSVVSVVMVIGIINWVVYARVARGQTLSLKNQEFIVAARSIGAGTWWIFLRHLLPNMLGPLLVVATFQLAQAILLESSMSFLGAGIPPPSPTWGGMLSQGRDYLVKAWWMAAFPGIALAVVALGINFLGDWLRDLLDPTLEM